MKTFIRRTALTSIAILLLLGGTSAAFASTPSQALNATLTGAVTNLGSQTYTINGGYVAYAYIGGQAIDPNSGNIQYNVVAYQNGVTTTGYGSIRFSATVGGVPVKVSGTFQIGGADPGAGLPAGCTTNCKEILPFDFIGSTNVRLTVAGQTTPETLVVESPYWNPGGAPIYIVSPDSAIVIVATYSTGNIVWTGAQVGGAIGGTLGSSPVSGTFSQTSTEFENLVAGTATDSGTFQYNTNIVSLNQRGTFSGSDYIPSAGSIDCSATTSGLPGTCTLTGFQSYGHFNAGQMSGTYSTQWGVPAYTFTSTIGGTVGQSGGSGNGFWGFFGFLPHF